VLKCFCGVTAWDYNQMSEVIRDNLGIINSTHQCQHCLWNKCCETAETMEQTT